MVVSDLPELRRLVDAHGVGWAVTPDDAQALAGVLSLAAGNGGADDGLQARVTAAAGALSWDREESRLLALYRGGLR